MQDLVVELLRNINISQLIAVGVMLWFFYSRLDSKIDKSKSELKDDMSKLRSELKGDINKLADKVEDVDRRLCRIEGSLATQGHCLFHQTQHEKKVDG